MVKEDVTSVHLSSSLTQNENVVIRKTHSHPLLFYVRKTRNHHSLESCRFAACNPFHTPSVCTIWVTNSTSEISAVSSHTPALLISSRAHPQHLLQNWTISCGAASVLKLILTTIKLFFVLKGTYQQ